MKYSNQIILKKSVQKKKGLIGKTWKTLDRLDIFE